ncbi:MULTISPECIES: PLP-dependent transferase [Pseudomonas]|uniref:PLP-dependent transferase n=1 Tax=Pseudomonas aphyarum TaxID=2942629 RepID=A0ABT5PSE2_9PSED|nr:PLP-dependent transferase [Pseudomonas aphyarum]MDD0969013.1 PLP-dependent transferase [Pseudomonas aphyarum]MDD1126836.1 PLP-dependent transferase [Pseudomonas aphyarum]
MNTDISINYLSRLYRLIIEELRETCLRHAEISHSLLELVEHVVRIHDQYWGRHQHGADIGAAEEAMLWTEYETAAVNFANILNARATIATCYSSMDEYWRDAQAQANGKSSNTIWDIYEHGSRRRLEGSFAAVLNVEAALLLNSGMSAISVAINAVGLKPTDAVFVGKSSYFETNEVLEHFVDVIGCRIHSIDFLDIPAFESALREFSPKLLVVETATNCPTPESLPNFSQVDFGKKWPMIICDQTIVGFPDADVSLNYPGDVVYLASLSKFVTNSISAGLIFGRASSVDRCRKIARFSGQNLQEHAFNFIRHSDITCVHYRMELHQLNVQLFMDALTQVKEELSLLRTLERDFLGDTANGSGVHGCLIFFALIPRQGQDYFSPELVESHRAVVCQWQMFSQRHGETFDIRSGFGWRKTSIRCYEGSQLNQSNAPSYMRISVGLESRRAVMCLAAQLVDSIREVTHGTI